MLCGELPELLAGQARVVGRIDVADLRILDGLFALSKKVFDEVHVDVPVRWQVEICVHREEAET